MLTLIVSSFSLKIYLIHVKIAEQSVCLVDMMEMIFLDFPSSRQCKENAKRKMERYFVELKQRINLVLSVSEQIYDFVKCLLSRCQHHEKLDLHIFVEGKPRAVVFEIKLYEIGKILYVS